MIDEYYFSLVLLIFIVSIHFGKHDISDDIGQFFFLSVNSLNSFILHIVCIIIFRVIVTANYALIIFLHFSSLLVIVRDLFLTFREINWIKELFFKKFFLFQDYTYFLHIHDFVCCTCG